MLLLRGALLLSRRWQTLAADEVAEEMGAGLLQVVDMEEFQVEGSLVVDLRPVAARCDVEIFMSVVQAGLLGRGRIGRSFFRLQVQAGRRGSPIAVRQVLMLPMAMALATSMPVLVLAMVVSCGNPIALSIREVGDLMGVEGIISVVHVVDTMVRVTIGTPRC